MHLVSTNAQHTHKHARTDMSKSLNWYRPFVLVYFIKINKSKQTEWKYKWENWKFPYILFDLLAHTQHTRDSSSMLCLISINRHQSWLEAGEETGKIKCIIACLRAEVQKSMSEGVMWTGGHGEC